MNKGRVESFSDCVFAFAITLLVMGIQVPGGKIATDAELRHALLAALPQLLPYVTSFTTIGIIWLNHHAMFHHVKQVQHMTLTLNLLLLLVVAFIPYPTAVLSRFPALPSSTFLYGAVLTLLGISYSVLESHTARRSSVAGVMADCSAEWISPRSLVGALGYPSATLLSLWHPSTSVILYCALTIFYFVPGASFVWQK